MNHFVKSVVDKNQQQGATLIVVLLLLLVLSSFAITAMQDSNTELKVATASQVNSLLFHANDTVIADFEQAEQQQLDALINGTNTTNTFFRLLVDASIQEGEQVIGCAGQDFTNFSAGYLTHKTADGSLYAGKNNGFCNLAKVSHYNGQGRVVTQFAIRVDELWQSPKTDSLCATFTAYATSVMPALSQANASQIERCLQMDASQTDIISSCLTDADVVASMHQQSYRVVPTGFEDDCQILQNLSESELNTLVQTSHSLMPLAWTTF